MSLTTPLSVQKLQTALHDKAKGSPNFRFYALYDKVYREDVMAFAYECCKANRGAAGVDGQTFEDIEEYGVKKWLDELTQELKSKTYRPQPVRRVYIPKRDGKQRPLGVDRFEHQDGHTRQLPRLTAGPFRYGVHAANYLKAAQRYAHRPVKQAVISASALSLLYLDAALPGYLREAFLGDLVDEAERDIRECLEAGAPCVQIDFTEGRLALKLDPSAGILKSFVEMNNSVLDRFSPEHRRRIGVHTCPGGDRDSTHSADVDYVTLLPFLFQLNVGRFYIQLTSEHDHRRVLKTTKDLLKPGQSLFVGVIDPINRKIETPEQVRDRVLEAAEIIPLDALGTTDDCGFSPFADDTSTSRDTAFAKIRSRIEGTRLASEVLGV